MILLAICHAPFEVMALIIHQRGRRCRRRRRTVQIFKSSWEGLSSNRPFSSKREPWHAQSQLRSCLFQCNAHPMCVHLGAVGRSRFAIASMPFTINCLRKTLREGSYRRSQGLSSPPSIFSSSRAPAIADVIPHLLKPVQTNRVSVCLVRRPIYGIPSSVIQSCADHFAVTLHSGQYLSAYFCRYSY